MSLGIAQVAGGVLLRATAHESHGADGTREVAKPETNDPARRMRAAWRLAICDGIAPAVAVQRRRKP
jgi:hypothetical protein